MAREEKARLRRPGLWGCQPETLPSGLRENSLQHPRVGLDVFVGEATMAQILSFRHSIRSSGGGRAVCIDDEKQWARWSNFPTPVVPRAGLAHPT
jgi:hypothetical protein